MQTGENLNKKVGFWQIWALGVGAVVGDGMFLMVASGAEQAGPACIISYVSGRTSAYVHMYERIGTGSGDAGGGVHVQLERERSWDRVGACSLPLAI